MMAKSEIKLNMVRSDAYQFVIYGGVFRIDENSSEIDNGRISSKFCIAVAIGVFTCRHGIAGWFGAWLFGHFVIQQNKRAKTNTSLFGVQLYCVNGCSDSVAQQAMASSISRKHQLAHWYRHFAVFHDGCCDDFVCASCRQMAVSYLLT